MLEGPEGFSVGLAEILPRGEGGGGGREVEDADLISSSSHPFPLSFPYYKCLPDFSFLFLHVQTT